MSKTRNHYTANLKTVVKLSNLGGELDRIVIPYDDATTEAIAEAVVQLVQRSGMSMSEGDTIRVFTEQG